MPLVLYGQQRAGVQGQGTGLPRWQLERRCQGGELLGAWHGKPGTREVVLLG